MKIQVTACDKDREVPALTYEIKVSDGRTISADLCARHATKIEAVIAELLEEEQGGEEPATEPEPVEEAPPAATAAVKKAPAKKAAAKKTGGRRRPRITTLAEIEAQKEQG